MSLRLKFNLVLCLVFLLCISASGYYYKHHLEENALNEVRHDSEVMMATALAIRSYTAEHVKPHLKLDEQFIPSSVPAFAAAETLRRLSERYPGYDYREAVLNPTNRRNTANDWEKKLIEKFSSQTNTTELTGLHGDGMSQALYVARPIKVSQPECLACHSTPNIAPASMVKLYGEKNGYGWQLGQTIGIQLVKIPMLFPLEKARQSFNQFMVSLLAIFGLLFLALNVTLSFLVIEPMARANRRLEDLATKDFLTDLVNRRRFFERLETAMAEARIKKQALSIVIFDIDFFKRINDTFGHDSGDMVLKHTALRVRELLRSSDCAARFGGEEFIILLCETGIDAAMALAEAVRTRICDTPFDHVGRVSASFGVAAWNLTEEPRALINRADKALYQAKLSGRNKVVRAAEEPAERRML